MDRVGKIQSVWYVDEDKEGNGLDLTVTLDLGIFRTHTCPYQVLRDGWLLWYGDRSLECTHERECEAQLNHEESIHVLSAGSLSVSHREVGGEGSHQKQLRLYRSHGNNLGQIACFFSENGSPRGMVRREACLRCCITAALKMGLDFVID